MASLELSLLNYLEFPRNLVEQTSYDYILQGISTVASLTDPGANGQLVGWHHDISLKNILVVSGPTNYNCYFKLADFGLSMFKEKGPLEQVKGIDTRGTRTYCAPETCRFDETDERLIKFVTQAVDVWSLGCIFSEAAVWVMHNGIAGIKDYQMQRIKENQRFPNLLDYGDCFHNGIRPLECVVDMHKKMMSNGPRSSKDQLTARVIEILVIPMLTEAPHGRPQAGSLPFSATRVIHDYGGMSSITPPNTYADHQTPILNTDLEESRPNHDARGALHTIRDSSFRTGGTSPVQYQHTDTSPMMLPFERCGPSQGFTNLSGCNGPPRDGGVTSSTPDSQSSSRSTPQASQHFLAPEHIVKDEVGELGVSFSTGSTRRRQTTQQEVSRMDVEEAEWELMSTHTGGYWNIWTRQRSKRYEKLIKSAKETRGRNHIYIIDNSKSMDQYKVKVKKVIYVLNTTLRHVSNRGSFELICTYPEARQKMDLKVSKTKGILDRITFEGNTGMAKKLTAVLHDFLDDETSLSPGKFLRYLFVRSGRPKNDRPLTVYIFTDGEGGRAEEIETLISQFKERLDAKYVERGDIGIQIVFYGRNATAKKVLKRADSPPIAKNTTKVALYDLSYMIEMMKNSNTQTATLSTWKPEEPVETF
ncbi:hypothetical protein EJ05DRAFT_486256 [Pseudovirgaria hyperparasitica]|uniref:Protein kinase domain-containing protein n=1 Tax=Pseudovirgaria hyperparasitica TaxID=470096 RepID=A0A6A6W8I9_9PEZI|nr:uncharacterized protein EJ05DRAFT_486256 [Pseudovirgaria hyperparasitica]KAF2758206.1 hypothetical protein EJ05DRAFT_486256 [Pseudovirgaria hyperparasitica]